MTVGNKKITINWEFKVADIIKIIMMSIIVLGLYFSMIGQINKNTEWIENESKPFHKTTLDKIHELDKKQTEIYEQIKAIGITTIDIKEELKYIRSKK